MATRAEPPGVVLALMCRFWLHFGLGSAMEIDRIRVYWPGGEPETFEKIPADQFLTIVQGQGITQSDEAEKR